MLTLFILDTGKHVLWQMVKTQMKCHRCISSESTLFAKDKKFFTDRNASVYRNYYL